MHCQRLLHSAPCYVQTMTDELNDRLRTARVQAGFRTASEATEKHGWKYPTYAGHENGLRGVKRPDLLKYAAAFGVSPEWLLTGRDRAARAAAPATHANPGMSENPVSPFHAPTDQMRVNIERLAALLAPDLTSYMIYQLNRAYPALALLPGDLLVVDQKIVTPAPGGIVVAQLVDEATDTGQTLLRLYSASGLIAPVGEPPAGPSETEAALGTVVASMRPAFRAVG